MSSRPFFAADDPACAAVVPERGRVRFASVEHALRSIVLRAQSWTLSR